MCVSVRHFFRLQGVQAQTVANFFLAFERDLVIIPVMNKIDLKVAKPEVVEEQLRNVFDFDQDEILRVNYAFLSKYNSRYKSKCLTVLYMCPLQW